MNGDDFEDLGFEALDLTLSREFLPGMYFPILEIKPLVPRDS